MRAATTILAVAASATNVSAWAGPPWGKWGHHGYQACMSDAQAQQVATNFGNLISDYSVELANEALAPSYTDYSASVNTLIDGGCSGPLPLDAPTFSTRAAFEKGQGSQPDIPFNQMNIWHTCKDVIIRWSTSIAAGAPEEVTGIIVAECEQAPKGNKYPWVIKTVYSEFNSGAWLVDLGVFTPVCNATASA